MKKYTYLIGIITTIALLLVPELDARNGGHGGGGGHGGRGGGGHGGGRGGGRSVHRSPSMSRAGQGRPERRAPQQQHRPAQTSRHAEMPRNRNRPPTSADLKHFVSQHPNAGKNNFVKNAHKNRDNWGNHIRHDFHNHPNRHNWFNNNFWGHYHIHPPYYNYHHNWWLWATPIGIAGWLGWNAAPIYYDYYIENNVNYWVPISEPAYVSSYVAPAAPESGQQAGDDWMPLGVFALSKDAESIAGPNIYLQLALNKNGTVSGAYYNETTDQSFELDGEVDPTTQSLTMQLADDPDAPVFETGLYNLTQPEAPVRVHFADGRTDNMLLIRLDESKQ